MRNQNIDQDWQFRHNVFDVNTDLEKVNSVREVNLPHDYMIESDVSKEAVAGPASGYYTEGVASYTKYLDIPNEWEQDEVFLNFDGIMMNSTVEVNGCKANLQHNGYIPFAVNITPYIYCGKSNRVTITVNPNMQPNSRWYTGAGIFRSVELVHTPKLHITTNGIFGYTKKIEYDAQGNPALAYLHTEIEVHNATLENKIAMVEVYLTKEGNKDIIISRKQKIQINPCTTDTAYINLTLEDPALWNVDTPNLYELHAKVTDLGIFKTHFIASNENTVDETNVLFGIKTIDVDVLHGLRINGQTVKLKGGCLHHDNGLLGAVSLYQTEYRKLSILKKIGFNAIRTSHNPPSAALMEACDRIGMYVFDEAFDAWGTMKQPGDYNQYFDTDWKKDLTAFIKRDRNHASVIIWSTGNEIPERGGLNNGYTTATRLAEAVRSLDPSRPVTNAVCSYWSGLDDELTIENQRKLMNDEASEANTYQNSDGGKHDISWEEYSEAFMNGLDLVGYNYMEDKYLVDHELYPDRVILGSENFPREIGFRWPMVENTPYVIGDFTWTAYDYIGEAGIGKSVFLDKEDPFLQKGPFALMSQGSMFPWRLANDSDVDIIGGIKPQGAYRSVVWGNSATYLYSYDPANYSKGELISAWGFTDVNRNWNWKDFNNKPVQVAVFTNADVVKLSLNGTCIGTCNAGENLVADLPRSFLFDVTYTPGTLEAISYDKQGVELSRDSLVTTGAVSELRLLPEKMTLSANGHDVVYVQVELIDTLGNVVPDTDLQLHATIVGDAYLSAFGSSNPITDENYTTGSFTTYKGVAMAVIRSRYKAGTCTLTVSADGFDKKSVTITIDQ